MEWIAGKEPTEDLQRFKCTKRNVEKIKKNYKIKIIIKLN